MHSQAAPMENAQPMPFQYAQQQQQRQQQQQQQQRQEARSQAAVPRQKHSQTRSKSVVQHSSTMSKSGRPQSNFQIGDNRFTVHQKYKLLRAIGHGAYGFVCSAENTETNEFVAIKKITNLFNNPIETKRAIREVQLLRKLRHENILGLVDLMMNDERTDLYLVSELMDSDLHQIIISKQHLSNDHVQYFVYQILRGLLFIHSTNCIHRDLKPSNILVNSNCDIKICDFGLARPVDAAVEDHKAFMTEYVATRWYRAPEIMLSWKQYSFAIDIWATGCILAELLGRMPLFPGKDYMDQLKRTLNYIGKPNGDEISHIRTERARQWVRNFPPTPRVEWRHLYPTADPKALRLLDAMLQFSPSRRISVGDALGHSYLEQLHDADDEPVASFTFDLSFEQQFEHNTLPLTDTKAVLERELRWFGEFQSQRTNYLRAMGRQQPATSKQSEQHKATPPPDGDDDRRRNELFQHHLQRQMVMHRQRQQHHQNMQNMRTAQHSDGDLRAQQMVDQRARSRSHPLLPPHPQSVAMQPALQNMPFINGPLPSQTFCPQPFQPMVQNLGRQPAMFQNATANTMPIIGHHPASTAKDGQPHSDSKMNVD